MHFSGRLIFAASSSYLIALSAATIPLSAQSDQIYHALEGPREGQGCAYHLGIGRSSFLIYKL